MLLNPESGHVTFEGSELKNLLRVNIHTYIEFALDLAFAGLYDEAIELIKLGISEQKEKPVYPMALYYKAWFESQNGDHIAVAATLKEARNACPDYCFPNQTEAVMVLEWAKEQNPTDAKAPYYLGNLWYNNRQYDEAIANWELSVKLDDAFTTVHRNLALAYFNKQNAPGKALVELEKAFALDETDSRILMELDQLYKRLNFSPEKRLKKLEKYPELVNYGMIFTLNELLFITHLVNMRKPSNSPVHANFTHGKVAKER